MITEGLVALFSAGRAGLIFKLFLGGVAKPELSILQRKG